MMRLKTAPEISFIMELLRHTFNKSSSTNLAALYSRCDPQKLSALVRRHGLSAYFHKHLTDNGGPISLPDSILAEWKQHAGRTALQNTLIEKESCPIFHFMAANKIDYLMLKGFAYAEEIYGSRWIRPLGDLDILIKKEDYPVLKKYLLAEGFTCKVETGFTSIADRWIELQEEIRNEMSFGKNVGCLTFHLDVHWDMVNLKSADSPLSEHFRLNIEDWFAHRFSLKLAGTTVSCLDLNAHFVHMVYHFSYGHQFAGVKWFLDICRFTDQLGHKLDWPLIARFTERKGCRHLFSLTKQMIAEILGPEHPAITKWNSICPGKINPVDYRYFKKRLFTPRSLTGTYLSFLMMPPTLPGKLKMLAFVLFNPDISKRWTLQGKKVNSLLQPFYILYWAVKGRNKKRA